MAVEIVSFPISSMVMFHSFLWASLPESKPSFYHFPIGFPMVFPFSYGSSYGYPDGQGSTTSGTRIWLHPGAPDLPRTLMCRSGKSTSFWGDLCTYSWEIIYYYMEIIDNKNRLWLWLIYLYNSIYLGKIEWFTHLKCWAIKGDHSP